jgi:hypothetical protein
MVRDKIRTDEVHFTRGHRGEAIKVAMEMVRKSGRTAELVICNDLPGNHTGGEDCFCDPLILEINPEDV